MSKKNQYGERVLLFLNKEWKAIEIALAPHLAVNLYINRVNKKNRGLEYTRSKRGRRSAALA